MKPYSSSLRRASTSTATGRQPLPSPHRYRSLRPATVRVPAYQGYPPPPPPQEGDEEEAEKEEVGKKFSAEQCRDGLKHVHKMLLAERKRLEDVRGESFTTFGASLRRLAQDELHFVKTLVTPQKQQKKKKPAVDADVVVEPSPLSAYEDGDDDVESAGV